MIVLLIGNGNPPPLPLFQALRSSCDLLIAADGGGNWCMENGWVPDLVTGDIDSFNTSKYPDVNIIKNADQETNDLEKALKEALTRGAQHVLMLGTTGARLDQTLKNISVLVQFRSDFESLKMVDEYGWMMILPKEFHFNTTPGTTISLFPVSGRVDGIRTEGLQYALNNEFLLNGVRDGSSNVAVADSVYISHEKGDLLLMVYDGNRSLFDNPSM
ncbi:MAG: thiamine diphosphokinase [Bacteroidetes bacterium]|nr:thiamine diphosphokinase [Bacteroidota bacterium]